MFHFICILNTEGENKESCSRTTVKTASAETFITHTIFCTSFMRRHHWEKRQITRLALAGLVMSQDLSSVKLIMLVRGYDDRTVTSLWPSLPPAIQGTEKGGR